MNKKGFVFVETIITIVFLAAALLILYTSYRSAITEEKEKVYYDDIGYLYRNYYIADYLINKSDIYQKKNSEFNDKYIIEITEENVNNLFTPEQIAAKNPEELMKIKERFNVNRMLLVSDDVIVECEQSNAKCETSYEGLSDGLTEYIKTMEIEVPEDGERRTNYYLVTEYREKSTNEGIKKCSNDEEGCGTFYVKLKLDINKKIENAELGIGKVCKGQNLGRCISENYKIENVEDENGNKSGIFHHDGDSEDSGNGEKEAKDNSYRYGGNLVNNWVCFGSDAEVCPTENLYRIIGVFGKNLKIIQNESDNKTWNSTETITKSYDKKWNNMIVNKAWNTEGMAESELSKDALGVYQAEITGGTKEAKQGLMYVSEYMYGASPRYWNSLANNYSEAKEHNWLYKGLEWTLSPVKGTSKAFAISEIGNVGSKEKSSSSASRMSMYLKDTVVLASGDGTESNPFRLADIGVIISDLSGEEGYYDITVNVEATTSEGEIVEYYYSICKEDNCTEWEKSPNPTHKFEGLDPDTEYEVKVKALNSLGNYSEEASEKFTTKYQAPNLTVSGSNANGNIESDTWTNKDLTIKGNTSGGIGGSEVYYCRTTESTCEPNTKGNTVTDNTEGTENICFRTVSTGARKTASETVCYKSKLDKQSPTCTTAKNSSDTWFENGVPIKITCTEKGSSGLKTCNGKTTSTSTVTTKTQGKNTYYVYDNAGNPGSCSVNITGQYWYNSRTYVKAYCSGGYKQDCLSYSYTYQCNCSCTNRVSGSPAHMGGNYRSCAKACDAIGANPAGGSCWVSSSWCSSWGKSYCVKWSGGYWNSWTTGYYESSCSAQAYVRECQSKYYYKIG